MMWLPALAAGLPGACLAAAAHRDMGGTVIVAAARLETRLDAYAQVEPAADWSILPPKGCPAAPAGFLWLKASFYGTDIDALRAGMTGSFLPDGGGAPVAVRVCSVFGLLNSDGGRTAAMLAVSTAPAWLGGQLGTVSLSGPARTLVAVPTGALVLDQGSWWVLVRTPKGDVPKTVVPVHARGWRTFIKSGLSPGEEVVVDDAYLKFHRNISGSYQPPD